MLNGITNDDRKYLVTKVEVYDNRGVYVIYNLPVQKFFNIRSYNFFILRQPLLHSVYTSNEGLTALYAAT